MPNPRLSIIIAVYNQERYLVEAIESVLDQDFDDREIIVVDDGSTDRSAEIARSFSGIRLIQQTNQGHAAALNTGIRNARAELLGFVDGDDRWEPNTLSLRVSKFDEDPNLAMTHGRLLEFISPELEKTGMTFTRARGLSTKAPVCGATLMRRDTWLRVGPFDEDLRLGAFMDWLKRARDLGIGAFVHDEILLNRRVHDANTTRLAVNARSDYAKLVKRILDRKRQAGEIDSTDAAGGDR
jgi:glycosyltransferase involved in cell wall biosynthesis